ncbi:hypothetical protein GGTG_12138 [Gaeumannomyces tritici R3-111a-1]|uniref:Uncharacterized protein n=1 Tax=Gaeumannomyces tritici (strain R3-111a-1) TaxID=644352 RepID=J3PF59_GAET3|nr:hypothetical protein GGTG_12138 [Gaeumannomyces tritici R3-111a-1]EJT69961.1 hypothetical protein GGTG_12138 [Gaeumannomyces tritici R3-111a-1]
MHDKKVEIDLWNLDISGMHGHVVGMAFGSRWAATMVQHWGRCALRITHGAVLNSPPK